MEKSLSKSKILLLILFIAVMASLVVVTGVTNLITLISVTEDGTVLKAEKLPFMDIKR